jgi:hypothetical protein
VSLVDPSNAETPLFGPVLGALPPQVFDFALGVPIPLPPPSPSLLGFVFRLQARALDPRAVAELDCDDIAFTIQ